MADDASDDLRKQPYTLLLPFGYNQFIVRDRDADAAGLDWSDRHVAQGFARRDQIISFGTLVGWGRATVHVQLGGQVDSHQYERIVKVPFHCPSGLVELMTPDMAYGESSFFQVECGHYSVLAAQRLVSDPGRLSAHPLIEVVLLLEPRDQSLDRSEVVKADADLSPQFPLLESADIPHV